MKLFLSTTIGLCLVAVPLSAQEIRLSVVPKGIEIEAGGMGTFVIDPPNLGLENGKNEQPVFEVISESEGVAKYPSGAEVRLQAAGSEILCQFDANGAKALLFGMKIPLSFREGGKFAFAGQDFALFPTDHAGKHVGTAKARENFTLANALGEGFTIKSAANWQAIQDNREFGWETFVYVFDYDLQSLSGQSIVITVEPYTE